MSFDPLRHPDPAAGYYRITSERRFMYLTQDSERTVRIVWQKLPVTCPMCATDTGLTLAYDRAADDIVQVLCPAGHLWPEPLIDPGHFGTYAELQAYCNPHPDLLWIIDAGFGEEPPPPIDYAAEISAAAKYTAKYAKRKAKARIKGAVRTPVRKAKKKALNLAFTPVAAVLRGAWALQAGGVPEATKTATKGGRKSRKGEPELKIPSVAKYRKAYGIQAPKKGPRCLVCEDSGRITAPGISVSCTECDGPAAAAMAAAERKAERARSGQAPAQRPAGPAGADRKPAGEKGGRAAGRTVTVVGDNNQAIRVNSTVGGGRPLTAQQAAEVREAVGAAIRVARTAAAQASGGVHVAGANNSVITSVTRNGDTRSS